MATVREPPTSTGTETDGEWASFTASEGEAPRGLRATERRVLGRYVVADPAICHGQLTFLGTRIFVADILSQVAKGMAWDQIAQSWGGSVSEEAIAEAVQLARMTFLNHWDHLSEDPSTG